MAYDFYDLDTWKVAHSFVMDIYELSKCLPNDERFGLISQIRRAAVSITSNIAEGHSRFYFKDKVRFYYYARASAAEVLSQLFIFRDLGYLNESEMTKMLEKCNRVRMLINGMIRAIETENQNEV
ncbi:TPA: four helix bundle protein [Candidatus Falkowbacteria bacterium]|nr:four helix bundle protein [Candidatus Falkowbacteria bacterium]